MKHAHVVIPDLFLPHDVANVCADLELPALCKVLARSNEHIARTDTLEAWLCHEFAVPGLAIAPVTLLADGVNPDSAYWMRADPAHLRLDRDQLILQTNVSPSLAEARQLCDSLNQHFAANGLQFFAPHPLRWYIRLEHDPKLITHSIYQVEGRNSRLYFPQGEAALKWHALMNEIQMCLHGHPINQKYVAQGSLPVNCVWFWGGGRRIALAQPFTRIVSDSGMVKAFAHVSNIAHSPVFGEIANVENTLHVWEGANVALRRGDFHTWRQSVLSFEKYCMQPLLYALNSGALDKITLDVLQEGYSRRFELTRAMLWKVWKRPRSLASYSLV